MKHQEASLSRAQGRVERGREWMWVSEQNTTRTQRKPVHAEGAA